MGARRVSRGQRGFTIIEVLIALVIGALITGAVLTALSVVWRSTGDATGRVRSSTSAFVTNARFVDDIASATSIDADTAVARNRPGCGGDSTSVLRVLVRDDDDVQVRSYSVTGGGTVLVRRVCSGPDLSAALAASTSGTNRVTRDLGAGPGAVNVTCRANVGAPLAPATPEGDEQCRIVTMTVRTATGFTFTLEGRRDTSESSEAMVPNVKKCTLVSSADTWITTYAKGTNHGTDATIHTFRRNLPEWLGGGELKALFLIDLLAPCSGSGEPAFLPGGKSLKSAELTLWMIDPAGPDGNWEAGHALNAIGENWYEDRITWTDFTNVQAQEGSVTRYFDIGRSTTPTPKTLTVFNEVNNWYTGTWVNNGWVLRRDAADPQDNGTDNGFYWGSRENSNIKYWPRLVVTWE